MPASKTQQSRRKLQDLRNKKFSPPASRSGKTSGRVYGVIGIAVLLLLLGSLGGWQLWQQSQPTPTPTPVPTATPTIAPTATATLTLTPTPEVKTCTIKADNTPIQPNPSRKGSSLQQLKKDTQIEVWVAPVMDAEKIYWYPLIGGDKYVEVEKIVCP